VMLTFYTYIGYCQTWNSSDELVSPNSIDAIDAPISPVDTSFIANEGFVNKTDSKPDTVTIKFEKYCESIYEIVDAGGDPPPSKGSYKFYCENIAPNVVNDSTVVFQKQLDRGLIVMEIETGMVTIQHDPLYYNGHDSSELPGKTNGIKKFVIKIDGKDVPILYDHIIHVDARSLIVYKHLRSDRIFLHLSNGDGAGSSYNLWVINGAKVVGHYDWSYGYDEWWPRKNLDAFKISASDKCNMYKISIE
jgi:hypothetical protein